MSQKKQLNWTKWRNLMGLGLLGFAMLFQYQNCAPAPGGDSASDSLSVNDIGPSTHTSALRFTYSKVQVSDQTPSTVLDGECDRIAEGTIVGWDVKDDTGASGSNGTVSCDRGKFQLAIDPKTQLECGKTYEVSARLADGTEGKTEVEMVCSN